MQRRLNKGGDTLFDDMGNRHGHADLGQIKGNEADETFPKDHPKADGAGFLQIHDHEPGGPEGVAHEQTEHAQPGQEPGLLPLEQSAEDPEGQAGEQETGNVAAGGSQQHTEAALESGEYRQPNGAQENVQGDADGPALAAQHTQGCKNAENLQGKGHTGEGDCNPRTYGDDCGKQSDQGQIADLPFGYGGLAHSELLDCKCRFLRTFTIIASRALIVKRKNERTLQFGADSRTNCTGSCPGLAF